MIYKRGLEYPNEGFVQNAIEAYFMNLGYTPLSEKYTDYVCIHPETSEKWSIEVKGETKAIGLDFRTCLGQLLQRMSTKEVYYGVAIQDMPAYRQQASQVQPWIRKSLNLHWLYISADEKVDIIGPDDEV